MARAGRALPRGRVTVGALAAHERVQPPSMTRTVNCLDEGGTPHAPARDRRPRVLVDLTEKGRESARSPTGVAATPGSRQRLRDLTPDERALLREAAPILQDWPRRD